MLSPRVKKTQKGQTSSGVFELQKMAMRSPSVSFFPTLVFLLANALLVAEATNVHYYDFVVSCNASLVPFCANLMTPETPVSLVGMEGGISLESVSSSSAKYVLSTRDAR